MKLSYKIESQPRKVTFLNESLYDRLSITPFRQLQLPTYYFKRNFILTLLVHSK